MNAQVKDLKEFEEHRIEIQDTADLWRQNVKAQKDAH